MKALRSCLAILSYLLATAIVPLAAWAAVPAVRLEVKAANELVLTTRGQTVPLKISLAGVEIQSAGTRAPINVAIILDRSGSMAGDKIEYAKEGVITALRMLRNDDIVSVVAYDDKINIVVPATKLGEDREAIIGAVRAIKPGDMTALFGGVSKGAHELRKFIKRNQVNRLVLLSDGIANVGPSSPGELGELGSSLRKEGISVTTLGLGLDYNEDLMVRLAENSDGNHAFVESPVDLPRIFKNEFGDVLSVVAQDIRVTIICPEGVRPLRVLGREAQIYGQQVIIPLNQIYGGQEKYAVLEVEAPGGQAGTKQDLASVVVDYDDLKAGAKQRLDGRAQVTYTALEEEVEKNINRDAFTAYYTQRTNAMNANAIMLRDQGRRDEAVKVLQESQEMLAREGKAKNAPALLQKSQELEGQINSMKTEPWSKSRKELTDYQNKVRNNQSW